MLPLQHLNVGELRDILEGLDPNLPVILQRDAEGNGFRLAAEATDGMYYEPTNSWSGEVYSPDELEEYGSDNTIPCFLIIPIN